MPSSKLISALVDTEMPSKVALSPDGTTVAFVLGALNKPDRATPQLKTIWLADTTDGTKHAIEGTGAGTNDLPRWSPDGASLAFTSNRDNADEMQLFLYRNGTTTRLTDLRGKVGAPSWSPDGSAIALLFDEKRDDPDPLIVDATPGFTRIWAVDVATREARPVSPADRHIFEYAWSPDGIRFAVLASKHPNPAEAWFSARLFTVDAGSGALRPVCAIRHQAGRLTWSPDSRSIAFVSGVLSDEGNIAGEVFRVPADGGEQVCLTPGLDHSVTWIEWRANGILYGGRHIDSAVLGWIDPADGKITRISSGTYAINGAGPQAVSAAADGTFAAVRESFAEPPDIWMGSLETGQWRQLTTLLYDDSLPPLRAESVHWQGRDGLPIHGFLISPPDDAPGVPRPLFVHVHGGPSWSYVPRFLSPWERLLIERGCVVLLPNPRGSWGHGHAFQSANVGDLGGADWQDVEAGVDSLIQRGIADPERLAIGGWSYAGYLTAWAVTQTDRYRCAIAGAAITSYESNYGITPNRAWQSTLFGTVVYDDYELHRARSPIAHAARVKTPTLLLHGMDDLDVPASQSVEFFQALKHFGATAQLVLYPREPHSLKERAHQIDMYERICAWVDTYLTI